VILEPEAAEEAVSSSNLVVGTSVRLDLCKIMLEKRLYSTVPLQIEKKRLLRLKILGTLIGGQHSTRG
jgi:hypothetical protein